MKRLIARIVLGASGLLLLGIGSAVLFDPGSFAASNGIVLPDNASLLSEIRAPGGMLMSTGVLIIFFAIRAAYLHVGYALSALVYCSYGAARIVGILSDGLPSASLTQAMVVELLLGGLCLALFIMSRRVLTKEGQR